MNWIVYDKSIIIASIDSCLRLLPALKHCSVEAVHEGVALVEGSSSFGHPVHEGHGVDETDQGNVDVAQAHTWDVSEPSEDIKGREECLNFL